MQPQDVIDAQQRLAGKLPETPCLKSETLSAMTKAELYFKFENQQFTASFKERGALNCLMQLSAAERSAGVIAMSAGNHAQALAYHGQQLGIPTTLVMPKFTPATKIAQTEVFGAEVILYGAEFDETLSKTAELATERGLSLVHPFNDPRVIAGQGTVGLEIMAQVPDLDVLVVPVGGGGLISGVGLALLALSELNGQKNKPRLVGVQMKRYPGAHRALNDQPAEASGSSTVAEGIAVKQPGDQTLALMKQTVDDILLVDESQVEQAVFELLEIEKTVVEGAGAVGLAAVHAFPEQFAGKRVAIILSGGNIDMLLLSSIVQRGLVRDQRLVQLRVEIPDVPGGMARLTTRLAELDCNIIEIEHQRTFSAVTAKTTAVELVLEVRGQAQLATVIKELSSEGFQATAITDP